MKNDDIDRFLQSLSLGQKSRYTYVTPLRAFRAFVQKRMRRGEKLSLATMRAWLKRDAARSPLKSVVIRAAIIVRHHEWQAKVKPGIAVHPMAALMQHHGGRLTPIVRALLQDDYRDALKRLRPLPEWGSSLGPLIQQHIARLKSLGFRYEARTRDLRRFDRYLQRHPELNGEPFSVLIEAWQNSSRRPRHRLTVQQCARVLSQDMHRLDGRVPIRSIEAGLKRRVLGEERKAYIFTEAEIVRLFNAARSRGSQRAPLLGVLMHTVLALAYCAGLRIGEIAALTLRDVDIECGVVEIRETKFFKARRLPLARRVVAVLAKYLKARAKAGAPTVPDAPLWWATLRRKGYTYGQLEKNLARVIRCAGLKPDPGHKGPRVHDLRHTFVAHRMLDWYRKGVETQSKLPHLATYLGHKDITSTLAYLNTTPELLQHASERYRRHGAHALVGGAS